MMLNYVNFPISLGMFQYLTAGLLWISLVSGCGQPDSSGPALADDNDSLLNELLGDLDGESRDGVTEDDGQTKVPATLASAPNGRPGRPDTQTEPDGRAILPTSATAAKHARSLVTQLGTASGQTDSGRQQRLELKLTKGDRFPMVKTVTQNLVQKSATVPASAETHLEMHMVMQVDDVQPDGILMNVQYTRIVYRHDINGQQLQFDSSSRQNAVPVELLPYAGMVNQGFGFWLGRNNKIRQLVGYEQFLQRCVQQVPAERRQQLLADLRARFGDEGVANFVDDTIGLLPYNANREVSQATEVTAGDVWFHERRLTSPVPLRMNSTCRLLSIDGRTAEIDITGRIAQESAAGGGQGPVQVREGRSMGSCVIDQSTGLPIRMNRSCYLNMLVTAGNGQVVEQDKRVETTIQTFPNSRTPPATASQPALQQAAFAVSRPMIHPGNRGNEPSSGQIASGQADLSRPFSQTGQSQSPVSGIQQVSGLQVVPGNRSPSPAPLAGRNQPASLQSTARAVYPD